MSGRRYGEPRERAQLELRSAATRFIVEAELMLRWLDQFVDDPPPVHTLEDHHAHVLGCARSVEAALNHVVALEQLAAEAPPLHESSHGRAAHGEPKTRRTIPIVGDPDKPRPETEHAPPSPTPEENEDSVRPVPAPQPSDSS